MSHIKFSNCLLLLITTTFILTAKPLPGLHTPELEVNPGSIEVEIYAGSFRTSMLEITNPEDEEVRFEIITETEDDIDWLSVDEENGVIPPDETERVRVRIEAHSLLIGEYNGVITVREVDADEIEVPVALSVIEPGWRDEIDFGSSAVDSVDWRPLRIANWRDEDLTIRSAESNSEEFWIEGLDDPRTVPPGRTLHLRVFCQTTEEGQRSGDITLETDHPDRGEFVIHCQTYSFEDVQVAGQQEWDVNLRNDSDEDLRFWIEINILAYPRRDQAEQSGVSDNNRSDRLGPERDESGDIIGEFELAHAGCISIAWDENAETMWVIHDEPNRLTIYSYDDESLEIVYDHETHPNIAGVTCLYDLVFIAFENGFVSICFVDEEYENWEEFILFHLNMGITAIAADHENNWFYIMQAETMNIYIFDEEGNCWGAIQNLSEFLEDQEILRFTWVPEHDDGQLWVSGDGEVWQFFVDMDEQEIVELVQNFHIPNDDARCGIGHDRENLWIGMMDEPLVSVVDDGISELRWITCDPREGILVADADIDIIITIDPRGMYSGVYAADVEIWCNEEEEPWQTVEVRFIVTGVPLLDVYPENLDFNRDLDMELQPNETYTDELNLIPACLDYLFIDRISFDSEYFFLEYFDDLIIDRWYDLPVLFSAPENGLYEGTMTIHSNDARHEELEVPLRAVVGPYSVEEKDIQPLEFRLNPAYPNPFNACTNLSYTLPHQGNIQLKLFDLTGRELAVIKDGFHEAGHHTTAMDASILPSGLYLVKLEACDKVKTVKMICVK